MGLAAAAGTSDEDRAAFAAASFAGPAPSDETAVSTAAADGSARTRRAAAVTLRPAAGAPSAKHLPGHPIIVTVDMPGGGIRATNLAWPPPNRGAAVKSAGVAQW
jgi:hypothetical protein